MMISVNKVGGDVLGQYRLLGCSSGRSHHKMPQLIVLVFFPYPGRNVPIFS